MGDVIYFSPPTMKADELYQQLRDFATKLGVSVEEHNLRETGIPVKSGLCVVRGRKLFVMDKHKTIKKKIRILAAALAGMEHENVYAVPAVRELLARHAPPGQGEAASAGPGGPAPGPSA
jgi:hypothetical protein